MKEVSKKKQVKVQRIQSDDRFVKWFLIWKVMNSWLQEEDFDEVMESLEADPEGIHSLLFSDIEPFLINITVRL